MGKTKIVVFGLTPSIGGIEKLILNIVENRHDKFDFVLINSFGKPLPFSDKFLSLGLQIIETPNYKKHPLKYYFQLKKILSDFDALTSIVYINISSYRNPLAILAAKKKRLRLIIHSHNADDKGGLSRVLHRVNSLALRKIGTKISCSEAAGSYAYGKNGDFVVIPNGIASSKYAFSEGSRNELLSKLGLKEKTFVIGYVGRISPEKNPSYVLEIAKELGKKLHQADWLIVMVGLINDNSFLERYESLPHSVKSHIVMIGQTEDVYKWYSLFDVLLNTSYVEAFPLTKLEALASGLQIITSMGTPLIGLEHETEYCHRVDLSSPSEWVLEIIDVKHNPKPRVDLIAGTEYELKSFLINMDSLFLGEQKQNFNENV